MRGRRLATRTSLLLSLPLVAVNAAGMQLDRNLQLARPAENAAAAPYDPEVPLPLKPAGVLETVGPAAAEPAAWRDFPLATQPIVVTLKVNAMDRQERFVRLASDGSFLLKVEDLQEVAYVPRNAPIYRIEGEDYVALASLPSAKVVFDEKNLALALTLPAADFPPQRFDLTARGGKVDMPPSGRSALLSYRLGYAGVDSSSGTLSLAAEESVNLGNWILRNQSYHSRSSEESTSVRLETQAIHDDRDALQRFTLGDSTTPGQVLGSSVPFGGFTFAKAYLLAPYFVRQPALGFRGLAEFPSEVDFYVGNTLVMRQHVAPGPFDISNFTYYGGQRDVRVVIRDAFGREQRIAYPFYFATAGLAAGLHDYSYQFGWLRRGLSVTSNDYGPFAFSAFHQYGFTDTLTLGLRTEGTARMANGGPDAFIRTERFGLWGAHAAVSHDRDTGRNGSAFSFSHTFQRNELSTQVIWQHFSRDYQILHADFAPNLPKSDFSASASIAYPALGSIGVAFTRLGLYDQTATRTVALSYSKPLTRQLSLTATARRQLSEPTGNELFVNLQYLPKPDQNVNLSWNHDLTGSRTTSLQWSNPIPRGEGLAYSFLAQDQRNPDGTIRLVTPHLDWYTRWATLSAEATRLDTSESGASTAYSLALSGTLLAAGSTFMVSRPVADSFAIAQLTPPLAGVRVYENNQEAGRTDEHGRILLPDINSYANNFVSIQDKDVPIEYSIENVGHTFSPAFRSGTLVPFALERIVSYTGFFQYRSDSKVEPLAYRLVRISDRGRVLEVPTGKKGDFYVENLQPGRHRAEVQIDGTACRFFLDVPAPSDNSVSLGEVPTCNVAPRP